MAGGGRRGWWKKKKRGMGKKKDVRWIEKENDWEGRESQKRARAKAKARHSAFRWLVPYVIVTCIGLKFHKESPHRDVDPQIASENRWLICWNPY